MSFDFMSLLPIAKSIGSTLMDSQEDLSEGRTAALKGQRSQFAANYEAKNLRFRSVQARQIASRRGDEVTRQTDLILSTMLARAAAGGGATDPMIMRKMSEVADEGAYRKSVAIYEGDQAALALEKDAIATEYGSGIVSADSAAGVRSSRIKSNSTLMSGGTSLFEKYSDDIAGWMS